MTRWLVAALTLALLAATMAGCGGRESSDETTSREAVSSATVEPTATTPAASSGEAAGAAAGAAPAGEVDTADLQAELEAIQRELDAMSLPDDTDFGDIESALQ